MGTAESYLVKYAKWITGLDVIERKRHILSLFPIPDEDWEEFLAGFNVYPNPDEERYEAAYELMIQINDSFSPKRFWKVNINNAFAIDNERGLRNSRICQADTKKDQRLRFSAQPTNRSHTHVRPLVGVIRPRCRDRPSVQTCLRPVTEPGLRNFRIPSLAL